ncbi:proline-rich protein 7 isoform X3 [Pseudopipra pipra]|uniref:proline-rich protein 7 isoform X3 n=1 Tax=Pseudopipra pipra TaxID=415032 RepID=UPI0031392D7E
MLSAVAWATAPPPAHHVAQGALPRLPPPRHRGEGDGKGKGKAAPGPRHWRGRRPGSLRPPLAWPDNARRARHAPHLRDAHASREHPSPSAWPRPPAHPGCCWGTPTTVEPALPGYHGRAVRSDRRRRIPASYLRRRVKRQQEERLREQSLRALEMEPLHYEGYRGSPPGIAIPHRLRLDPHHHHHPHHIPPPRPWSCRHESDLSKPPCYEEALLMAEPPPPYSEVLMDTRGLYRKINAPFLSHERLEKQEQPPSYKPLFLDASYGSALHLPRSASPGPACPDLYLQQECSPRMFPSWTDSELSSRDTYEPGPWHLPVSMPLFGRTTAV